MTGVRNSDNSDEAEAFFREQGRADAQARPVLTVIEQSRAAIDDAEALLRELRPTRELAARRQRFVDTMEKCALARRSLKHVVLKDALFAAGKLLADLANTRAAQGRRDRFFDIRAAINDAVVRLGLPPAPPGPGLGRVPETG